MATYSSQAEWSTARNKALSGYKTQGLSNADAMSKVNTEYGKSYQSNGAWIGGTPKTTVQPTAKQPVVQQPVVQQPKQPAVQPIQSNDPTQFPANATAEQIKEWDYNNQKGVVEGQMQEEKWLADKLGLQSGPTTIEEIVAEQKKKYEQQKSYTQKQIDSQNLLDQAEADRFNEQAQGAKGATNAAYAQGREGAVAGSASSLNREFTTEMDKRINENQIRLKAAQDQRNNLMLQLEEAQKSGNSDLIESISGALANAQVQIDNSRANVLNALTQANEQARLAEQSTRANVESFTGLINSGVTLDNKALMSLAGQLKIPVDMAMGWYQAAEDIRTDKQLDLNEKKIALEDLAYNKQLEWQGYRTEQAKQIKGITDMVKSGKITQAEAGELFAGLKIDSSLNPFTRLEMQSQAADLKAKEIGLKYLDAEKQQALTMGNQQITSNDLDNMIKNAKAQHADEREILELEELKIQVRKNELEKNEYEQSFANEIPANDAKQALALTGKSRVTPSFGEGKKQCAEAYNDYTNEGGAGDSYASKMKLVTKTDNPKVGNGLVIPLAGAGKYGHIETVISVNNVNGEIQTVSYNRDLKGGQTIQSYKIEDLKKKYGDNWGFTDSTFKPEYEGKLKEFAPKTTGATVSTVIPPEVRTKLQNDDSVKKVKAANNLDMALKAYQDLVEATPDLERWGANKTKLDAAYTNLKIQFKNASELGAITAADVPLIEGAIKPMTKDVWDLTGQAQFGLEGGKQGVLNSLATAADLSKQRKSQAVNELNSLYPEYSGSDYFKTLIGEEAQDIYKQDSLNLGLGGDSLGLGI